MKLSHCCNRVSRPYRDPNQTSRRFNRFPMANPNSFAGLSPVNFEAANGSTTLVPRSFDPTGTTPIKTCPKTVVCVTLDARAFRNPQVYISFNTEIHIKFATTQTIPASVEFELVKSDGCGCCTVLATSTYSVLLNTAANDEIIHSFSFNKVISSPCHGCCDTYCVRIVNPINNPAEISLFELRNPTLYATVKSNCPSRCC